MKPFDMHTVKRPHIGNNIRSLMKLLDMKQDVLADGLDRDQQFVSRLLNKEDIEDELLDKIAKIMDIPADAIKNYSSDAMVSFINNSFTITTHDSSNQAVYQDHPTFNYGDKLIAYLEKDIKEKNEEILALRKEIEELKKKKG